MNEPQHCGLDGQTPTLCRSSRARGLHWSSRRPAACFLLSSSTLPVHSMHQQGRGRALWLARGTALPCDYGLGAHGGPCHVDTSTGLLAKYQRDLCKGKEEQRHPGEILSFLLTTSRTSKNSLSYNTITHSVKVVQEFSNTICKNLLTDELSSPSSLASLSAVLPLLEEAFCPFSTLMGRVTAVVATKQCQKHLILGDPHQKTHPQHPI